MDRACGVVASVVAVLLIGASQVFAQLPVPGPIGGLTARARVDASSWIDTVSNGGFETDPVLAAQNGPWTPSGPSSDVGDSTAAWSVDATVSHSGAQSMKMYGYAKAEAYQVAHLPAGSYTFTGWIKTGQGGTGRARLMVDLRTWRYETVASSCATDCGINSWYTSQEISAGSPWVQVSTTFTISDADVAAARPNAAFPGTIKAFAVLDGYWAGARLTAWYDDVKLLQQPKFPLDVFMRYPNYRGMVFSDQEQTLRFRVSPVASYATADYRVRSTLTVASTGAVLEQTDTPLATVSLDADTGKPGIDIALNASNALAAVSDYQPVLAEFTLLDGSGHEVAPRYPTYRIYKVPASSRPLMNVSFNAQNEIILGVPRPNDAAQNPLKMPPLPRFTLGVYDSGLGSVSTSTNWEQLLFSGSGARRMTGLPINLYLNYHLGDTDAPTINNLISTLNNHAVAYLQTGNCFSSTPASAHNAPTGFKIDQPGSNATYGYVSDPPPTGIGQAVAGYYTADECTADLVDGVFGQYQRLVKWDPDSMTFAALLGTNDLPLWRDVVDVISTDPYPLYGAEPAGGYYHGEVAEWTRMAVQAVQHSRPVMTVLQFFKFDASRSSQGRWPTQTEMRNHAYMAIIEGAKGLMWWSLGDSALDGVCRNSATWCSQRTQLMDRLKAVVGEIASLEAVLLKPDATWDGSVQSVTENTTPVTSQPTSSIRTLVKHDELTGKDYVFAYNTTPYYNANVATPSVTVHFALRAVPKPITVYGEDRSIQSDTTPDGTPAPGFSDKFGPFEAHVYVISY